MVPFKNQDEKGNRYWSFEHGKPSDDDKKLLFSDGEELSFKDMQNDKDYEGFYPLSRDTKGAYETGQWIQNTDLTCINKGKQIEIFDPDAKSFNAVKIRGRRGSTVRLIYLSDQTEVELDLSKQAWRPQELLILL